MRCNCPICLHLVIQDRYRERLNFCPNCRSLFVMPSKRMPSWILGVLVVLTANWQLMVLAGHPLL